MSVDTYPDGSVSGVAYTLRGKGSGDGLSWWAKLDEEEREEQNRYRVGRRAGGKVRKLIRYGDLRRLLTFTNGGEGNGWPNLREAMRTFSRWYRSEGRYLLGESGCVVVAERGGKRRRVHLHAAIRAGYRLDYARVIRSWSAHLEAEGWHSATGLHRFHAGDDSGKHSRGFASARVCAGYMAKYLAKGFAEEQRLEQERRYVAYDCHVPEPRRMVGFRLGEIPDLVADTFGASCTAFFDGEGLLSGFWFDVPPP